MAIAANSEAVAGVKNFLPISIARRLMERELHTLLVGAGAEIFARECGLLPEPVLTDHQRQEWNVVSSRSSKAKTENRFTNC